MVFSDAQPSGCKEETDVQPLGCFLGVHPRNRFEEKRAEA